MSISPVLSITSPLRAEFVHSVLEVREAQAFRYRIFVGEMGATIHDAQQLDRDHFDRHCHHLVVRDERTSEIVAYTRLLTRAGAQAAGGFYSAGEFLMDSIVALPGNITEIGRTCVDSRYRNGSAISVLWSAIADWVIRERVDYLIGCASVPMQYDSTHIHALMNRLWKRYLSAETLRVIPSLPIPPASGAMDNIDTPIPPLLKAYLRLGAQICGTPFHDEDFRCADFFVLLQVADLVPRYARHFLNRIN